MEALLAPLLPLFERERAAGRAVALAVVVHTAGSTYRKPGAMMLVAADGEFAGLLSGGCLESDLAEHARAVIETGEARLVSYDLRNPDDLLWGLGVGCEGAMQILLLRAGPANDWQPLEHFARALASHTPAAAAVVVASDDEAFPPGTVILPTSAGRAPRPSADLATRVQELLDEVRRSGRPAWLEDGAATRVFALPLALPPRVLLLGAGPDALPVVELAARLGWKVTLCDHRPAYARPERFPAADRVVLVRPQELAAVLRLADFDAAVVMSHHLPSDLEYLRTLAGADIGYVGLLGPAARRERLLADLGADARKLRGRLHAPVGLALGGRSPESIALAIVAEIHACLHGTSGGPFAAAAASASAGA